MSVFPTSNSNARRRHFVMDHLGIAVASVAAGMAYLSWHVYRSNAHDPNVSVSNATIRVGVSDVDDDMSDNVRTFYFANARKTKSGATIGGPLSDAKWKRKKRSRLRCLIDLATQERSRKTTPFVDVAEDVSDDTSKRISSSSEKSRNDAGTWMTVYESSDEDEEKEDTKHDQTGQVMRVISNSPTFDDSASRQKERFEKGRSGVSLEPPNVDADVLMKENATRDALTRISARNDEHAIAHLLDMYKVPRESREKIGIREDTRLSVLRRFDEDDEIELDSRRVVGDIRLLLANILGEKRSTEHMIVSKCVAHASEAALFASNAACRATTLANQALRRLQQSKSKSQSDEASTPPIDINAPNLESPKEPDAQPRKKSTSAIAPSAYRDPESTSVRLMHVFEGVRNEVQCLIDRKVTLANPFPKVVYDDGQRGQSCQFVPGSFKCHQFRSTKFSGVFKAISDFVNAVAMTRVPCLSSNGAGGLFDLDRNEAYGHVLVNMVTLIRTVEDSQNDRLLRALYMRLTNQIFVKLMEKEPAFAMDMGWASAFLCLHFPLLYGFLTAQLIRECPFFAPLTLSTLPSKCTCGQTKEIGLHGLGVSIETWSSCRDDDKGGCHGQPRHGPSMKRLGKSIHQTQSTPGDHEFVESAFSTFYAGLLTGVDVIRSSEACRQHFASHHVNISDASISIEVSRQIGEMERRVGKSTVALLSTLSESEHTSAKYTLYSTGPKPKTSKDVKKSHDFIANAMQTADTKRFGFPYGLGRIWQFTAYWVSKLCDSSFDVPFIVPRMLLNFIVKTRPYMARAYGRQYNRLLVTLKSGLERRIKAFDPKLLKCGLCFVDKNTGRPSQDLSSEPGFVDLARPLQDACEVGK